jgi:hypothetical protein
MNVYPIMIPEVAPGIYRFVDAAFNRKTTVTGFVIVEVIEDLPDRNRRVGRFLCRHGAISGAMNLR